MRRIARHRLHLGRLQQGQDNVKQIEEYQQDSNDDADAADAAGGDRTARETILEQPQAKVPAGPVLGGEGDSGTAYGVPRGEGAIMQRRSGISELTFGIDIAVFIPDLTARLR